MAKVLKIDFCLSKGRNFWHNKKSMELSGRINFEKFKIRQRWILETLNQHKAESSVCRNLSYRFLTTHNRIEFVTTIKKFLYWQWFSTISNKHSCDGFRFNVQWPFFSLLARRRWRAKGFAREFSRHFTACTISASIMFQSLKLIKLNFKLLITSIFVSKKYHRSVR